MEVSKSSTRLYALIARDIQNAIIFRRGPSKHVQLLKWDLETDNIIAGQWLKGRVYERRCDLSPDGEYLIYFAANYKSPYGTWTAISKPPFFTALALWPKGDAWGGGGMFDHDNKGITLNHRLSEMKLAEGFNLPSNFRLRPHGEYSGSGEDDPILSDRLTRDGWKLEKIGKTRENKFSSKIWFEYIEPQIWSKQSNSKKIKIELRLLGIKEKQGAWYIQELKYIESGNTLCLGRCDWADLDPESGIVYFSIDGFLKKKTPSGEIEVISDLSENSFENLSAPTHAKKW